VTEEYMDRSFVDNQYVFSDDGSEELPLVLETNDQESDSDLNESTHTDLPVSPKSSKQTLNILNMTSLQTKYMMSPQISKKMPTSEYSFDINGKTPNTVKAESRQELP
jgi:hypothetical protein